MKKNPIHMIIASALLTATLFCSCAGSEGKSRQSTLPSSEGTAASTDAVAEAAAYGRTTETSGQDKFGNVIEFDKTIHNFGDVMLTDGALHCTFTLKNISSKPIVIYNVVTSCGCTDVRWTREPIQPGKTGTISSSYSNDEGPYPFDKTLTAYISDVGKPVILHLRGISHDKKLSLDEMYPLSSQKFGMKGLDLKCGNVEQGSSRSDEVNVANLSSQPMEITFREVSDGLSLKVLPNPIPARSVARLQFTVTARRDVWGRHLYKAVPVANGKDTGMELSVYGFTKENFSGMTAAQRAEGPRPIFTTNTFSAGKIKAGSVIRAEYTFTNVGKEAFRIHKVDVDTELQNEVATMDDVKAGYKGKVTISIDTEGAPKGEILITATLTTNSPSRPIVNLFISALIQ